MSVMLRTYARRLLTVALFLAAFGLGAQTVFGDRSDADFDVARYIEATVARLQMVRDAMAAGALPTRSQQAAVLAGYGLDERDYYLDASRHATQIAVYLENHPGDRALIESLSEQIKNLVSEVAD
ncbi:hypothetical protein FKG94_01040 [Exilibacterium tricleocarpae]|uniref:DUF4168 domain-containing protein n=1 Tax=Exilibacterium tricleocarpae TaxID=2591008 RepID=A0A545U9M5_9GAMM|nr:hypothetical protein [Exilibacterium tricleocarpae]TQV86170.1 hypothetical protein FKG94_01040 [Exilibacterium tricleocarpae]